MSVREMINRNKSLSLGMTIAIVVVVIGGTVIYNRKSPTEMQPHAKAFYTIDDGATWFVDDANKLPPFEHEGKTAYRCYLFTTDGGNTKFVSHLERYTPQAKEKAEAQIRKGENNLIIMRMLSQGGIEVKRPKTGDSGWIPQNLPEARALARPQSSLPNLEPVWP